MKKTTLAFVAVAVLLLATSVFYDDNLTKQGWCITLAIISVMTALGFQLCSKK